MERSILVCGEGAIHLREALRGEQNASYYSTKTRAAERVHSPELAALRESA